MIFKKKIQNEEDKAKEDKKPKSLAEFLYGWVETLVLVPVAVVFVFAFIMRTSVVSGTSMLDTLHDKDMMIISGLLYEPSYGDIVVVTQPSFGYDPIVKRVIATEGQTVDIDFEKGVVSVDGIELDEPYTYTPTNQSYDMEFPITIKKGHCFVMGDNRNGSYDSRAVDINQIDNRMITGKAYFRVLPREDFGKL